MGTREIAKLLHMSFTDIAKILKDADKEKEAEKQRTRQEFMSSQAYKLFSDGKSPVEVAIELNRAPEAIILQREYWDLVGIYDLNHLYEGIKSDILYIANLWNAVKASGMQIPHVLAVLNIANNHLPNVEQRYSLLKQEVESLQERKRDLSNQVTIQSNELEYYLARCQQEKATFNTLLERGNNAEDLVKHFENNNQEYVKIRRTVEEKVNSILFNAKPFIQLALYCIIESIKKNPYRYSPLVSENMPSSESYYSPDYFSYSNDRPTYFDSKAFLAEEAANM
jgi:hypothetical protein